MTDAATVAAKLLFWTTLAALLWTHALYPLFAAGLARVRSRPVRRTGAIGWTSQSARSMNSSGAIAGTPMLPTGETINPCICSGQTPTPRLPGTPRAMVVGLRRARSVRRVYHRGIKYQLAG